MIGVASRIIYCKLLMLGTKQSNCAVMPSDPVPLALHLAPCLPLPYLAPQLCLDEGLWLAQGLRLAQGVKLARGVRLSSLLLLLFPLLLLLPLPLPSPMVNAD